MMLRAYVIVKYSVGTWHAANFFLDIRLHYSFLNMHIGSESRIVCIIFLQFVLLASIIIC